ncbi:MAG: hypothetical protein AAF915_08715 [Cyanobacteria bacterium P01_D01_bin.50]
MRIKTFGFALLLGLATTLGACESPEETPSTDTPAGEPADAPTAPPDAKATPTTAP